MSEREKREGLYVYLSMKRNGFIILRDVETHSIMVFDKVFETRKEAEDFIKRNSI